MNKRRPKGWRFSFMQLPNEILIPEIGRLLAEGYEVRFTPSGVSMRPFIEGGKDTVVLKRKSEVRVGDICLCRVGERFVLHRVITVENERITMQGDGNLVGTESCSAEDVLGTVIRIESPHGKEKKLTDGRVWYRLKPLRRILLKVYRHSYLKIYYGL